MIRLCERFHCLPSQLYAEGAHFMQLLNIYSRGNPETGHDRSEEVPCPYG